MTVETTVREGVLRVRAPGSRWLATGHDGGYRAADAAYNVSVPEGFDRTDLGAYVTERRERAGFEAPGPVLLTGVSLRHARGARVGSVVVVATAGLSNPATLPVDPGGGEFGGDSNPEESATDDPSDAGDAPPAGTVNLLAWTDRALADGGLASLLATVVEAKTATLLPATGFSGTTSDAVVVGCDSGGDPAAFAGSATPVGTAARACVREAVLASLDARYADAAIPGTVADAEYGTVTDRSASVFHP